MLHAPPIDKATLEYTCAEVDISYRRPVSHQLTKRCREGSLRTFAGNTVRAPRTALSMRQARRHERTETWAGYTCAASAWTLEHRAQFLAGVVRCSWRQLVATGTQTLMAASMPLPRVMFEDIERGCLRQADMSKAKC